MKVLQRKINKEIHLSFKIAKQNINKPELNVLQGQCIHTLLHPYPLSLTDNLPFLSESRIFTTGRLQPALRIVMHLLRTNPANKCVNQKACVHRMHKSPECRLYQWSIRIKRRYAVPNVCRERDIVRPPAPVQITPELPTATMFYSGI